MPSGKYDSNGKRKRYGLEVSIGTEEFLTIICFADDVLMIAKNIKEMRNMIDDIIKAARQRGLEVHDGKTKVLTNAARITGRKIPDNVIVGDKRFKILEESSSTKWLGRKVSFQDPHETELNNRISAAWRAFAVHKDELTNKKYRLKDRLRLFDAVITSTVTYGCETWVLKTDQQRRLRTTQRKMLRMVLNAKRRRVAPKESSSTSSADETEVNEEQEEKEEDVMESWADFLKRTAKWTEEQLKAAGQKEWLATWRTR